MKNHDFMVERRMLAYITLLSGNLEAMREFVIKYADKLPFSPQFIASFAGRIGSLEVTCDYSGQELIKNLSGLNLKEEVLDETH
jgi:hypothetical protein